MRDSGISVIMPTYNQGYFINRAVVSLSLQSFRNWELIIINDGSADDTHAIIQARLFGDNVRYLKNEKNLGLGESLNRGIAEAKFEYIAYLPSDDIYYADHLQSLYECLVNNPKASLAYSGVKSHYKDQPLQNSSNSSLDKVNGCYQLVQVMHKKNQFSWKTRKELVTDRLDWMYWNDVLTLGDAVPTNHLTCEWVSHPFQRHKMINEIHGGGIYTYKNYFKVKEAIRFKSGAGNYIDETVTENKFKLSPVKPTSDSLKILLVGELAYNAERITVLEKLGHKLYGLWMRNPSYYNAVGPLPFGNVTDLSDENWKDEIKKIKPDIIYALLNVQAVPFAHEVLKAGTGIPFVWHFKEGPFFCRQNGTWKELIDLYTLSDGQIFICPEARDWYCQFLPKRDREVHILDGDLPPATWFKGLTSPLLSSQDGNLHTVVPGRPFGLMPGHLENLAKQGIHLHFYGDIQHAAWREWIETADKFAPGYLHIHPNCNPENWVQEFSKYDAGWLHYYSSTNFGESMRVEWNDLNYPARMPTLAAAGLPMIQKNNSGHIAATDSLIRNLGMGLFIDSLDDLGGLLRNENHMASVRNHVWTNRKYFTFDQHAPKLISFFKKIIAIKNEAKKDN